MLSSFYSSIDIITLPGLKMEVLVMDIRVLHDVICHVIARQLLS